MFREDRLPASCHVLSQLIVKDHAAEWGDEIPPVVYWFGLNSLLMSAVVLIKYISHTVAQPLIKYV